MNIVPKDGPSINSVGRNRTVETGPTSRERAMARLLQNAAPKAEAPAGTPTGVPNSIPNTTPESKTELTPSPEGQISNTEGSTIPVESSEVTKASIETPAEDPISSQFALLARKEKALRAKAVANEQAIKAREEAIRAKEEAIKLKETEYQSKYVPKDRIRQDLPSLLAEAGLSSEEIGELISNAPSAEEVARSSRFSSFEAKIKELEQKLEASTKSVEEREKRSYDQALNQISNDVKRLVSADSSYELVKATGSESDVVKLIQRTFDEDGTLLDIEEATAQVEAELLEDILKVSRLKKIQDKLSVSTTTQTPKVTGAPAQQPQTMKTLTNSVASSNKLSARDRALKRFRGEQF